MVGPPLRVAFFGTPAFAVPTLDALLASRHTVVGVVTQPDRPRGRGQKVSDAPVKARALEAGLPILQPATLRDETFLTAFRGWQADLGVVAAYGKILTEAALGVPHLGMVNVHASLLPRYRGAAPVHRAVIAGDRETGVTIMRVVKALDAGPMLAKASHPIGGDETSDQVEAALAALGAPLLVETLDRLADGRATETPQDDSQATYAPRITKEDGLIDWSRPARDIHNLVRGLYPWPHAYSYLDAERLIIWKTAYEVTGTHPLPGTIVAAHGNLWTVAAADGVVHLQQVQAEGRRAVAARDFLAGHPVRVGSVFAAPR
ncbi:MAG TPA: methionyl-tRNA formyltransferase [Vicinamibacterales bacterium]|jgi:methionyl-tRNA formyltransferase